MSKRTPLYERHVALGAKMVPFAGWDMPVDYESVVAEHRHVRARAGLFDVSHMGEIAVGGEGAERFVSLVTSNDPSKIPLWGVQYSAFLNERGGFVDDLLVYRLPEEFLLVVNAANTEKDFAWLKEHADGDVGLDDRTDATGEVALQGPSAEAVLSPHVSLDLPSLGYYTAARCEVCGVPALVSRTGYTGEDGFEVYADADGTRRVFETLLADERVAPVGLAARDTLRLEAGYPLYGHEMDDATLPQDTSLGWIVAMDKPSFVGKSALVEARRRGWRTTRVGLVLDGRGVIPRQGAEVLKDGRRVGAFTSGTFCPSLGKGAGMALVERGLEGGGYAVVVRGVPEGATRVRLPLVAGSVRRER